MIDTLNARQPTSKVEYSWTEKGLRRHLIKKRGRRMEKKIPAQINSSK